MGSMRRMLVGLGLGAALVGCAGGEDDPLAPKPQIKYNTTTVATGAATTATKEPAKAVPRTPVAGMGGGPQGMGGGGSAGGQPNMAGMQGQGGQGQGQQGGGQGGAGGSDMPNFGVMRGGQGQGQGQGQQGGGEAGAGGSDMNFGAMRGGQGQGQGQQGGGQGGAGGSDKPNFESMRGGQGQGQGSSGGAAGGSPVDQMQGGRKGSKKEKKKEEESKPEDAVNLFLDGLAASDKKDLEEAISAAADSPVLRRLRTGKWGEKELASLASLKKRYADNTILVLEVKTTPNDGERRVAIGVPSAGDKPTKTVGEVLVRREVPRVWRVISVVKATGS